QTQTSTTHECNTHSLISASYITLLTLILYYSILFFFNPTPTTEIYTLSLHDALPISARARGPRRSSAPRRTRRRGSRLRSRRVRSEEHTSELQSQSNLVCRLLLEKKKKKIKK